MINPLLIKNYYFALLFLLTGLLAIWLFCQIKDELGKLFCLTFATTSLIAIVAILRSCWLARVTSSLPPLLDFPPAANWPPEALVDKTLVDIWQATIQNEPQKTQPQRNQ